MASESSFKLSQLAAQGNGVSPYTGLWFGQDRVKEKQIEVESSDSKCTCIVLALLAIMAAAGSIALFFYSGDFTNHQVIAFATGFGILSIGFIGGICYRIVKYMQATKKLSEEREAIDNQEVSFKDALEKIMAVPPEQKPELMPEQMKAVLAQMDNRIDFIKFVHKNFFTEDKAPLSQNQKLLIRCFNYPSDIEQLVHENYKFEPQFVLEILLGMDPIAEITEQTAPANKIIGDLILQVSRLSDEKYPALTKHPVTLAHTLLENDLHPLDQIIAQMSDAQKTTFLKYLADEWERSGVATEKGKDNKERIEQIVTKSIKVIVDQSLVEQFVLPEGEAAPVIPPAAQALLTQLVRFPEIASCHINLSSELVKNRVFLDALDDSLDPDQRTRYLQAITEREAGHLFISTMSAAINEYKEVFPELLKSLYKQQPRALYSAKTAVHSDAMKGIAVLILNMTEEDKQVFRNEEKKSLFNNTDTVELVCFAHKVQTNGQEAVNTLNTNPGRFVELVLKNPYLSSQEEALLLLQEMQPKAVETAVDTMDSKLDWHHYDFLIERLQNMLKGQTKESIDDKLKTLVAIFRYAPADTFIWSKTKFSTVTNKKRETDPDWKLFREIAEEKKEAVWRTK